MGSQQNADLTNLLRWSIENSSTSSDPNAPTTGSTSGPRTQLDQEALRRLVFGGPSDADRMKDAMATIQHPDASLDDKLTAFDNFEQLVEQIDNANNMEPLKLWQPLVDQLNSEEAELRKWAAWCLATAVANNAKAQERMMVLGAIPTLVKQATQDSSLDARKKAILALSSGVRNYQPAMDQAAEHIPKEHLPEGRVDAANMEAIDGIMKSLRESSANKA
ncbi:uncharacterized protein PV09_09274 [Verruconis gallopava]|uniref:Nucleotide exchange factor Fes1 domain-containing protein n=1 Tax=Verruconis gallopava TaxID=253628 RepID=A0A0D1ZY34_9PEZI|nr:uncharacterized protein PV09_09274 [Verruconis gallopava]KIV98994.1 hypothetical protein PV09_09274 [Verruconis gallopava]